MVRRNNMKKYGFNASRIATILLAFLLATGLAIPAANIGMTGVYAADPRVVGSWDELRAAVSVGTHNIILSQDIVYDGSSIVIPEGSNITITPDITGNKAIYSSAQKSYDSMFKVKGSLTIDNGVTLSGKIGSGSQCPDGMTYTADKFTGEEGATTYTPKGFFIDVEDGGTATLNGTISDFVTSRNKATTPRFVAPVVAKGATFNLGTTGVIKNNVVGYIVDEDKAYTNAQEIKQYVKGAPPNSLRKPSAYDQKQDRDKYERVREKDAGIDGGSPGSGITATAGAVIYKDGAKGNIEGTIDNNRGDTGGVMASGKDTEVHIKGNTVISRNVGVQFGGGSTTEQGAVLAMHSGTMKRNVAWFGGGAVFATQNGVDWLLGHMLDDTGKPDFDARKDGKFAMAGGELTENTAFTRGGAILVDSNGVAVKAGKLTNNMSWMLGGAVYVMGDHPKYTYTMHIDPVYVHDNLAVSGKDEARANAATTKYTKEQLDEKNTLLQRKLTKVGSGCADPTSDDLFDDAITDNTDDSVDGKGNDGTGGGVWLCPYGSVIFDAARTDAVVIDSNYATGTVGGGNADSKYNSKTSTSSRSGISAGSDLHTDQGKQDGGVTITGLTGGGWVNENTNQPYTTETSSNRTNLVSTRTIGSDDVPNRYQEEEYVLVTGNIARRGGGLASDGKFYFGPLKSTADLNAKMTVSKVWTPSANTEPIAIRIIAKQGSSEVVVADVPLDGIENPPVSEFDTVSELAPNGNTWTGEFALPYVVTDANGNNIKLFSLFHGGNEIDLTKVTGREKLGELLKENKQDEVEVQAAQGVNLIFKEMNVEKDGDGNWVATDVEHSTHTFTPNNIDFSSLTLTKEKAEETMEDVIGPDGEITQKPSFGTYTAGLALQLETGNDNEAIVEKYVNKDVHADIVNFDQDFTYDIMAYVPIMAKEFTVSDTLVLGLEFADKDGNAVTDGSTSTIEKISVKTINDHKPDGTVSQAGMPDSEGKEIDLSSGNADIQINGNKLVVKIDENTYYKNKNNVDKNALAELRGRWVQVTFHARIKDEYRNIDALKALTYGDNKNSWLNDDEDNKYSDQRHEATFANGDLVLADALFKQFSLGPDPIIWAVEGPSRLFAKTASGDYYATPMEDKSGSTWSKLEVDSADWRIANNRYNGTPPDANNTIRALDTEGTDAGLVAALKDMPLVKGAQLGKGAEGQERIFIEVNNPKAVTDDNQDGYEIYSTTIPDHKSGRLWEKLEPGSTAYNNGKERLKNDRYTLRMLDFAAEGITLSKDGVNWPVISEDLHEGMSNQASYDVKFGNDSESSYRSNIVTVAPKTTELKVEKLWGADGEGDWPDEVKSVTFEIYAIPGNNEIQPVYVEDGKVVGVAGTQLEGSEKLTVTLTKDNPRATVEGLPRLKDYIYLARETKITDKDGQSQDLEYSDSLINKGVVSRTTKIGNMEISTSMKFTYAGKGAKFESLRDKVDKKVVRGAIADGRLWAMTLDGSYYVTNEGDTEGDKDSVWTQVTEPTSQNPDDYVTYDRAKELFGVIEEFDNDKIEDIDAPGDADVPVVSDKPDVFDIENVVTAFNGELKDVEVTKKWKGATKDDIPSAEAFKSFLVLKNGKGEDVSKTYKDKLEVTARGTTYIAKWSRIPKDDYTIEEKPVPGFESEIGADGVITNTKKPFEEEPEIEKYVNQAVHKDIKLDEVFTYDIIAYVTKDADSVTITDKLHDMLTFEGNTSDVSVVDLGEADNHLVTNNIAGVKVNDKATVAEEGRIIDGTAVTISDQTLTVFITNKLKKTVVPGEPTYTEAVIEETDPSAKGYYVRSGSGTDEDPFVYTETTDFEPVSGTTYYEKDTDDTYKKVTIEPVNPKKMGYYERSGDGTDEDPYVYTETQDTIPNRDKTYYEQGDPAEDDEYYEYDGEDQPVTALRGHWIKVTFKARINDKTLEEVKKAYQDISASDADPVISAENHTGIPNDASYTIGVANVAGMKEDVHRDKSNIVTVKPKDEGGITPKPDDGDDVAPADEDAGTVKSADTGDETPLGFAIFGLLGSAAAFELMRRRRMS